MANEGSGGGVLRELLAVFGFEFDTRGLKEGENKLGEFGEKIKKFGEALGAAFAVEKIHEFVKSNSEAIDKVDDMADTLGISTERVQEFTSAAKGMGQEADALLHSMSKLQVNQALAASGSEKQAKAFREIHTTLRGANGELKSADELFLDTAEGIADIEDPAKRAKAAVQLFGKQGAMLLPILKEGRKGVEEYLSSFMEGGYTEEAIEQNKKYQLVTAQLESHLTRLKSTIFSALAPAITWLTQKIDVAVRWFNKMTEGTHTIEVALVILGAIAAKVAIGIIASFWPILAPVIAITAAVTVLSLLIDDFITMLEGGNSVIGDFIDGIFGKGTSTEVVEKLRDTWKEVVETAKEWWPAIKEGLLEVVDVAEWLLRVLEKIIKLTAEGIKQTYNFAKTALKYVGVGNGPDKENGDKDSGVGGTVRGYFAQRAAERAAQHARENFVGPPVPGSLAPPSISSSQIPPGNSTAPQTNVGGSSDTYHITVHAAPGQDEKQIGVHVANQVAEVNKQERRAARANLQRKVSQ